MKNIYDFPIEELGKYLVSIGEKDYRKKQLYEWLYQKKVDNIKDMTNVKDGLSNYFSFDKIKLIKKQVDKDVVKFLFELNDKSVVETVLLRQNYGNSLCVSTQVGCNMGCTFCASGTLKKIRNLDVYEMVLQVLLSESEINEKITHIVVMGIGEPFDNYDNLRDFIKIINSDFGLKIGSRHITVSTCGIIPKIKQFEIDFPQVNLAISLHSANNEVRSKLMPINKVYKLEDLRSEVVSYVNSTNRRITFEYLMLEGINDSLDSAYELINYVKGINAYVNLIPYNETNLNDYKKTKKENIMKFYDLLKKNHINVTIRKELGTKVDAACGQLMAKHKEEN